MQGEVFKNNKEIDSATIEIASLLRGWGLDEKSFMIGKYLSHFYLGVFTYPKDVLRDINIYILKDKLPWAVETDARSVIPPKGKFFDDYNALQNKYSIGLDLIPIPGVFLTEQYIVDNRLEKKIGNYLINFESIEKFLYRMHLNVSQFDGKPRDEIRNFYFVDEKRYKDRLEFNESILKYANKIGDKKLITQAEALIGDYKGLVKYAYPELFDNQQNGTYGVGGELVGKVVSAKCGKIVGKVKVGSSMIEMSEQKFIFVFTHFFPADAKILSNALAIITDGGGILCHAAIVCRELGIPCVVDTGKASKVLKDGELVEIDTETGIITKRN